MKNRICVFTSVEKVNVAQLCPTFVTPWTVARQAPLSMEFSRQEYWSGLPFPSPRDLPNPGIEPIEQSRSHALPAYSLPFEPPGKPFTSVHLGTIGYPSSNIERKTKTDIL